MQLHKTTLKQLGSSNSNRPVQLLRARAQRRFVVQVRGAQLSVVLLLLLLMVL